MKPLALRLLLFFLTLLGSMLLGLTLAVRDPALRFEYKFGWLLGVAVLFLLGGCAALLYALAVRRRAAQVTAADTVAGADMAPDTGAAPGAPSSAAPSTTAVVWPRSSLALLLPAYLLPAYLLPYLVFRLPGWLVWLDTRALDAGLPVFFTGSLTAGLPGYPAVAALLTGAIYLTVSRPLSWPRITLKAAVWGILAGLALWLVAVFIASPLVGTLNSALQGSLSLPRPPLTPANSAAAVIMICIAPWSQFWLFRHWLPTAFRLTADRHPQNHLTNQVTAADVFAAIFYAVLQARLLLLLPAILFSLALSWLYRRTHSAAIPILAHAVFNALMVALNLYLVF